MSTPGAAEVHPEQTGRIVRRPRLAARIGHAVEAGSLIITAGAGSGKTTILEEALEGRTVAWLNCSQADRSPGALLMRVTQAIAEAVPGASDAFAEQLAAGMEPVDPVAATRELTAELSRLLVNPLIVVVDDGEQLERADGSIRLVSDLIRAELRTLRIAVASRRPLGLRVAKARAAGRVTELTATDLVFDAEECEAMLRARTRRDPSPEDVQRLMETTEGWPLGVAVAAGIAERGGSAALEQLGSASDLRTYLAEELFDSLDTELQAAAIDLSIARVITPHVTSALGHPEDVGRRLEGAGVPLRWVREDAFTYHPLVRDFLLDRIDDDGDEAARLHAAVAPAVAKSGESTEAIEHWIRAESWPEVVGALQRHGMALVRASPQLVGDWLDGLPPEAQALPAILTLRGQIEWLAGDSQSAIEHLRAAVAAFREHPDPRTEWLARMILTDCLFTAGLVDEFEAAVEGWDQAPAAAGPLRNLAALFTAISLAAYGRFDRSEELVEQASLNGEGGPANPSEGLLRLFVDMPQGRLDQASEALRRSLTQLRAYDPASRIQLRGALALTTSERGHPEEALELWQQVQREGRLTAPALSDAGHGWCALLHARAGRLDEAEAELALYRGLEAGSRSFIRGLAPASIASLRGDPEGTVKGADLAVETVSGGPILFRSTVAAELAPDLVAVERPEHAAQLIDWASEDVDGFLPGKWGAYPRARLGALRAWLADLEGDTASSDRDLQRLLGEGGDGPRFAIRREWPRLEPLTWSVLEREVVDPEETIGTLSRVFPGGLELVPFLDHPVPAARAAALPPAVRSGHPEALERLRRLEDDEDPGLANAAAEGLRRLAGSLPPLSFEVLGGFAARRGAWRIADADWGRPVDARLVRFLLVQEGQPVLDDLIFEALWPDRPVSSARRSLQVSVSRARRVLDPPGAERSVIESGEGAYRLTLDERATVDAHQFQAAADRALETAEPERRTLLERARSLWEGEPLPEERYSDWATSYREALIDRYIGVLTAFCELHERAGDHLETARAARELVDLDPLNEQGHRALMTAYARTGRRGHALRQYLECRRSLVDSVGIEPAEETSQLQARILAGEAI